MKTYNIVTCPIPNPYLILLKTEMALHLFMRPPGQIADIGSAVIAPQDAFGVKAGHAVDFPEGLNAGHQRYLQIMQFKRKV